MNELRFMLSRIWLEVRWVMCWLVRTRRHLVYSDVYGEHILVMPSQMLIHVQDAYGGETRSYHVLDHGIATSISDRIIRVFHIDDPVAVAIKQLHDEIAYKEIDNLLS